MVLTFMKRFPWGAATEFAGRILNGKKIHTIRQDKTDRWGPGRTIHFYWGSPRQRNAKLIKEGECTSTQMIVIKHFSTTKDTKMTQIFIDGKRLTNKEMVRLASNDGFKSLTKFLWFFNKDFAGKIIHWTNLKY